MMSGWITEMANKTGCTCSPLFQQTSVLEFNCETPCSAIGTYLSPICTNNIVRSTWDLFIWSLWKGLHLCTIVPSMPCLGTQLPQTFAPPLLRHSSLGHCTSTLRPRLMPSYTHDISVICKENGTSLKNDPKLWWKCFFSYKRTPWVYLPLSVIPVWEQIKSKNCMYLIFSR